MSSKSKSSSGYNSQTNKTLSRFDRGSSDILRQLSSTSNSSLISLQLLFFSLLEVFSSHLTDNDPIKSRLLFQLQLRFLQASKILPTSVSLSAGSIRQSPFFQNYVRILRESIQAALSVVQRPPSSSDNSTIISILEEEYTKSLLSPRTTSSSSNISIDIPQVDIQLKVPLPLTMNGSIMTSDFNNIVVFRYIQDFYEIDKLGKGAFGSVFRARNYLDDRMYAIKKIVFNENNDRTRRQAKRALLEVRVLASLSHPNIVQYHCAWLELVPVEGRTRRTSSSASPQMKKSLVQPKQFDSLDELIKFEGQSESATKNKKQKEEVISPQKSSTTSTSQDDDEDENEMSLFGTNGNHSDIENHPQYHSDGDHPSLSASKIPLLHSTSCDESISNEKLSNKQLIPLHSRNQNIHPIVQSNYVNSKIVLFIQMQLCDTTLHDWLRYRDHTIIEELSNEKKDILNSLNDLGQRQCWHIFKQLLTAVEYLHSKSFIHRDIKPRNIFLSYDSKDISSVHVKLGDFGLATLSESELSTPDSPEQRKDGESNGVGTALYAPPEQLNSNHCTATAKSDSYSLGIVLFELFNIFPTEMERYCCLSDLRIRMKVDEQFAEFYPFETNIIEQLVSNEAGRRPNVEQLLTMYSTEIERRMKKQQTNKRQIIIEQLQEKLLDKEKRIQQLELELERKFL